jgi:putative ABC transport system permease protein
VRIPPIAAISDRQGGGEASGRHRFTRGAAVALVGGALLAVGLSVPVVALVGAGAAAVFVGAAMLAPAVARPLSSAIGRPLAAVLGAPGKLGRENSMRNPRRTAQTASALMIGIALVSAMAVFGASVSRSATSSVDDAISADLIISGTSNGSGSFSRALADAVTRVPGVTASLIAYGGQFEVRQSVEDLKGVSTRGLSETVILHMTAGSREQALGAGDLLVDSTTAKSDHLSVGAPSP